MERDKERLLSPRDRSHEIGVKAVAAAIEEGEIQTDRVRRTYYKEVRQKSDDVLNEIELLMLKEGRKQTVSRDLDRRIRALFFEINDVLDFITPGGGDRRQPFYPSISEFTARKASDILLNHEQRRLLEAGTNFEFVDERDSENVPLKYVTFWEPTAKAS